MNSTKDDCQVENNRILLIQKDEQDKKLIAALIQKLGLSGEFVGTFRGALESVAKLRFGAIFLDCQTEGLDSFKLARTMRSIEQASGGYTPIIGAIADDTTDGRQKALGCGIDDFVNKPLRSELLSIKLNHWLRADVAFQGQKFAYKISDYDTSSNLTPIDVDELTDFYGADGAQQATIEFLQRSDYLLSRLRFLLVERESNSFVEALKEMRGASAVVGAKQILRITVFLEKCALQEDWDECANLIVNLDGRLITLRGLVQVQAQDASLSLSE